MGLILGGLIRVVVDTHAVEDDDTLIIHDEVITPNRDKVYRKIDNIFLSFIYKNKQKIEYLPYYTRLSISSLKDTDILLKYFNIAYITKYKTSIGYYVLFINSSDEVVYSEFFKDKYGSVPTTLP